MRLPNEYQFIDRENKTKNRILINLNPSTNRLHDIKPKKAISCSDLTSHAFIIDGRGLRGQMRAHVSFDPCRAGRPYRPYGHMAICDMPCRAGWVSCTCKSSCKISGLVCHFMSEESRKRAGKHVIKSETAFHNIMFQVIIILTRTTAKRQRW